MIKSSVVKQLIKEFCAPFFIAVLWTLYNIYDSKDGKSIKDFVNIFGPAFFLSSWAMSQWFRVRKQIKVDKGLDDIKKSIDLSLESIEKRTNEIINNLTGGDSACYLFGPSPDSDYWMGLMVFHVGQHPIYEVSVKVVDVDAFSRYIEENKQLTEDDSARFEHIFKIGTLSQKMAKRLTFDLPLIGPNSDSRKFNVFFTALNGVAHQLIRCKKVNGKWRFATKLIKNEKILYEKIDDEYPVSSTGEVVWD